MLQPINEIYQQANFPDLLIGLENPDDAAAWQLNDGRVLVMTTDFFTPVVDDPYDYGAIAAANSLSDVYAMGAAPFAALTVAALPPSLDVAVSQEIIRGLAEKTAESGAVIVGGHTIQDKEPKIGLVVLGFCEQDQLLRKDGLQPGDRLVLTKPLGFGTTTTAIKQEKAAPVEIDEVITWMKRLNNVAAELAIKHHLRAATDVTGFSLLGHAWEMVKSAGLGAQFFFDQIPFVSGAKKYADEWIFPGGAHDNRQYYGQHVEFKPGIPEAHQLLLFDPQTSGGLLLGVPGERVEAFMASAKEMDCPAWLIGETIPGEERILVE